MPLPEKLLNQLVRKFKMINLLLIGLGPHAQRCYLPIFKKYGEKWRVQIACGVDLQEKKPIIEDYFSLLGKEIPMFYVPNEQMGKKNLSNPVRKKLEEWVEKFKIKGVIIATEPLSHYAYADWALEKQLSVLLDKPITTNVNVSTSILAAKKLITDYNQLEEKYLKLKTKNPKIIFSVHVQRRYHRGINKIRDLIAEVYRKTNCPLTFIQAAHADGQWRMPNEIIDLTYHGFNYGYGVCSHSGYHLFDTLLYLLKSAPKKEKEITSVEVIANFIRPDDLIAQLTYNDYIKIFPDFLKYNNYSEGEYSKKCKKFGEVDAFISLIFKSHSKTLSVGMINLFHNSLSQRGWLSCQGRDLYKGNGRIGHEFYQIIQGPFQTIYVNSFKSGGEKGKNIFGPTGEYHWEIHVFRNKTLFPNWKEYEVITSKDLKIGGNRGELWGQQLETRVLCVKEFVDFLHGKLKREELKSELPTHRAGVVLLSAAYQSGARQFRGKNQKVEISFSI